jgi:hypothetical protein
MKRSRAVETEERAQVIIVVWNVDRSGESRRVLARAASCGCVCFVVYVQVTAKPKIRMAAVV